ncbi:MAG: DUF433 domain-containing protein [Rhizobiales bacterium]|nr:DUF433 domain-containing protein [Hyphomicrobiales bacterium]
MEHPRISQNPEVMVGKPVIKGTRIPVELILRMLGGGHSVETILDSYPHLSREDIFAAPAFAADALASVRRYPSFMGQQVGQQKLLNKAEVQITDATEPHSLLEWLKTIQPWDEDFPEIDDPPPEPVNL